MEEKTYRVELSVEGAVEVEVVATSQEEAEALAIENYGNEAWYNFFAIAREEEEESEEN